MQFLKHSTKCQHTNYHNTTKLSGYLLWPEQLWSRDISSANKHMIKYCKTFDSLLYFTAMIMKLLINYQSFLPQYLSISFIVFAIPVLIFALYTGHSLYLIFNVYDFGNSMYIIYKYNFKAFYTFISNSLKNYNKFFYHISGSVVHTSSFKFWIVKFKYFEDSVSLVFDHS